MVCRGAQRGCAGSGSCGGDGTGRRSDLPNASRGKQQHHDRQEDGAQREDADPRKLWTLDRVHVVTSDVRLHPNE
jgi:hypothetical protein